MEPTEFIERLRELNGEAIADVARALRLELDSADGEVSWWRATIAIGSALKRQHRSREAGLAAHDASVAVIAAAARAGLLEHDRVDVIVVARAASEVARALVAGPTIALPAAATVLAPWQVLLPAAA